MISEKGTPVEPPQDWLVLPMRKPTRTLSFCGIECLAVWAVLEVGQTTMETVRRRVNDANVKDKVMAGPG